MGQTILLIDDNRDEVLIAKRVLGKLSPNLRVEVAMSGEEGLAKLLDSDVAPFLILLDMKMTGMTGTDTLQRIRSDERLKHIPVVVLTNSRLESDQREALEAGADRFLHKSYDMNQFKQDIRLLLQAYLPAGQ